MMRGLGPFLRDAWRLALPYFRSEERWAARGLLAAVVALNLAAVAINLVQSYWSRAFYDAVQNKDWQSYIDLLLLWKTTDGSVQIGFTPLAAVFVTMAVYRLYLNQLMDIRWRRWMTEQLLTDWFSDRAYWRIALAAGSAGGYGTDNPPRKHQP